MYDFFFDQKGNEQIIHFGIADWWISDYDSLINRTPSILNIQAIEDTEILELTQGNFEKLCETLPKTERLFRIIMEKTYIASQKRLAYMFSYTGEEFYQSFVSNFRHFANRIPQYMLASYLGMTPESLSKIKAKQHYIS